MTAFTFRDLAFVSGRRLLYPNYVQVLLDRINAEDVAAGNTQGLEVGVTDAISTCVQALKNDGILGVSGATPEVQVLAQSASLIKAACFMMGARTLSGALVPLAADMPAPTNFNLVGGDYDRKTGVQLGGAGKYVDINADNSSASLGSQNDKHLAVYVPLTSSTNTRTYMRGGNSGIALTTSLSVFVNSTATTVAGSHVLSDTAFPFIGVSRAQSSNFTLRARGANSQVTSTSSTPTAGSYILGWNGSTSYTICKMSFYSTGTALDLAILEARLIALSQALAAAIP